MLKMDRIIINTFSDLRKKVYVVEETGDNGYHNKIVNELIKKRIRIKNNKRRKISSTIFYF